MEKSKFDAIRDCFYKGKYKLSLEQLGREPLPIENDFFADLTVLQIGSLIFLGDFFEAEVLFKRAFSKIPKDLSFQVRCQFYLGIGCVRRSEYKKASHYFAQNLVASRKSDSDEILFYSFQGAAFFSIFKGQFHKTQSLAQKAYSAAFASKFLYGQVLSLDLAGHADCQMGAIHHGLSNFEKAYKICQEIGNGGISTALQISLLRYRTQYGHNILTAVQDLKLALRNLSPEDTYSRAELYLELVRQLLLRGQGKEAQEILEEIGKFVYRHQNKRQSATYNLRFAHLLYLKGEYHAAFALTHALKQNLDPQIDKSIWAQGVGLEKQIRESMGQGVQKDSRVPAHFVDKRIRNRAEGFEVSFNQGEDLLGDVLDRIRENSFKEFYEVKSKKLYGLLPKCLSLPVGKKIIYLGPSKNEMILISDANVVCVDKGMNRTLRKLMLALKSNNFKTKEELIRETWGYQYDPLHHDSLLYATIAKLRNLLGDLSYWIEWSSNGYKLMDSVLLKGVEEKTETELVKAPLNIESSNVRQIKFLNFLKPGEYMGVQDYAKRFKVCTMTACRDLSALYKQGRIVRIGRGRATVYSRKM